MTLPSPSAPSTAHQSLDDILRRHFVNGYAKRFLPRDALERIISEKNVEAELLIHAPPNGANDVRRLAAQVYPRFRRIFAILVLIDRPSAIHGFLDPGNPVSDQDLPLQARQLSNGMVALRRAADPETPLPCFIDWKQAHISAFENEQWIVNPPVFAEPRGRDNLLNPYEFDAKTVLPLLEEQEDASSSRQGSYAMVTKVKIHPSHHSFPRISNDTFALKRFKRPSREDFDQEVRMLKRFSVDTHPNLITLLATWKHGDDYFLLFPWAPHDLLEYWELHRTPSMALGEVCCASKQLLGIVDALRKIHNYQGSIPVDGREGVNYGRHGDIKAENILVFHDSSGDPRGRRMVLADLGLGRFNSYASKSTIPSHKWSGTPNTQPPECDIKGRTISRSWDIWALGIFYLDYAIWLLLGYDEVERFTNNRRSLYPLLGPNVYMRLYFDVRIHYGTTVMVVKEVVTEVFTKLHAHEKCSPYIHDLLDLVEDRMLIVETDDRKRASSEEVYQRLFEMQEKCLNDEDYCVKPSPWPSSAAIRSKQRPVPVQLNEAARARFSAYMQHPGSPALSETSDEHLAGNTQSHTSPRTSSGRDSSSVRVGYKRPRSAPDAFYSAMAHGTYCQSFSTCTGNCRFQYSRSRYRQNISDLRWLCSTA